MTPPDTPTLDVSLPSSSSLPRRVSVPAKFLLLSTIGTGVWLVFLSVLGGETSDTGQASLSLLLPFFVMMCLSGLVTAAIYLRLPDRTVDIYHRFGKASAMFIAVNVTVSLAFVAITVPQLGRGNPFFLNVLEVWVFASMFLPGPYFGALIAARWSQ